MCPEDETVESADLERPDLQRPTVLGFGTVAVFFVGFLGWAAFVPLESAALAPGVVSLDTSRKTVQHLEGGIVTEILVREGDQVESGQVLLRLDDTRARARIELLESQISSAERQLMLLREELAGVRTLFKKGLTQKPRLLALERRIVELEGELSQRRAEMSAAKDVLARSAIRAPLAGKVIGLKVHTTGGVITGGEPLLYIIPEGEPLIIEARVQPTDIDEVRPGLAVNVHLTPYSLRSTQPIKGRVVWVAADSMTDERSGDAYYATRIELTEDVGDVIEGGILYPGMPAEVMIITGKSSLLDYLIRPLSRSLARAFREK